MKTHPYKLAATLALALFSGAFAPLSANVIDFSDLALAPGSFYNGGPATNTLGWTSGGATFGNGFDSRFGGFWNGFAYSSVNDSTTAGFGNQYAAFTGAGFGGSGIYAVAYSGPQAFINLPGGTVAQSIYLTNTTYAALSMREGDSFAKKFGGATGNDADFFDVTVTGFSGLGATGSTTGAVTFRLADYTFPDNSLDYIVGTWTLVDLTPLGGAASLGFGWASSDMGGSFINTPTYVALDNLTVVPEPASAAALTGLVMMAGVALRRRRRSANQRR
ncbi:MAG: DUF4465 domain-containing protein [Verrucomicrobia bacterium]|nr:MAG: DUF4465 domain-containing protein [Verrucomicrobiota bacterium]